MPHFVRKKKRTFPQRIKEMKRVKRTRIAKRKSKA